MIISKIIDRNTYLHFAAGIIAYYWGFTLIEWIVVHILLDIFQRTEIGKKVTKFFLRIWPESGDLTPESYLNILGDSTFTILGWCSAYLLDKLLQKAGLYEKPKPELGGVDRIIDNTKHYINNIYEKINNVLGNDDVEPIL